MRKIAVWASLVSNILLVVTGGIVRLTASGLGCPTWPTCTGDSMVPVPEAGIHGIIENTNRALTIVLVAVAIFTAVVFWRSAQRRLTILMGLGIPAQAVIGGISVLTQLNPWVVGLHFVVSALLIAMATSLVWNFYGTSKIADGMAVSISRAIVALGSISVLVGIVVTGAGPHSGDAATPRNGLDLEFLQHVHSYPAYITLALVVLQIANFRKLKLSNRVNYWLLGVLLMQALVGIAQSRLGVPAPLVAIHLLGASVLISLIWLQRLSIKKC